MVLRPCVGMQIRHDTSLWLSTYFAEGLIVDLVKSNVSGWVVE